MDILTRIGMRNIQTQRCLGKLKGEDDEKRGVVVDVPPRKKLPR
jgi:hypothetical protein